MLPIYTPWFHVSCFGGTESPVEATTSLAHPWQVCIVRNMHEEIFNLLKLTVIKGDYGTVVKKTKCVEQLQITTAEAAIHWMVHVVSDDTALNENKIISDY